jgi:putative transposase
VSTQLRDESPGVHHVVCRGNNKRIICDDDTDRAWFCDTVTATARKYHWHVLAWCLMDNHYHLLITVTDRGLAAGMCELNSRYARIFNQRHDRVSHLFGERYWSRRAKTHAEVMNVVRYIVQNLAVPASPARSRVTRGRATQRPSVSHSRRSSSTGTACSRSSAATLSTP